MSPSSATVVIDPDRLRAIVDHAEAAFPEECCGLLAGDGADGIIRIDEVHASENIAAEPGRRFEVEPALRLRLQRTLRDRGRRVVGIYHSHPNGPAQPSSRDLEAAWEPDLVWLVVGVRQGQAVQCTSHVLIEVEGQARFTEVPLTTTDTSPVAARETLQGGGLDY